MERMMRAGGRVVLNEPDPPCYETEGQRFERVEQKLTT
jgi:hypothetical protein